MPSIVKTNSRLAAGDLQLVSYNFETQADQTLAISADFLCLPTFANSNMAALRTGAPAPSAIMQNAEIGRLLSSVSATTTPTVRSATARTSYGLTTISVTLGVSVAPSTVNRGGDGSSDGQEAGGSSAPVLVDSVASSDDYQSEIAEAAVNDFEITTSIDLKSLSGSVYSTEDDTNYGFSFNYYAETITTEGNVSPRRPRLFAPFGIRSEFNPIVVLAPFTVRTLRTYRNGLGVNKSQLTQSAIYVQQQFVRQSI